MKALNVKKAAWSFVLAAAMLLAVAPAAAFADAPPSVALGEAQSLSGCYSFPNATVSGDVATLTVSVTGAGKISSTTAPDMRDISATSMTFTFSVDSQKDATSILKALTFSECKRTTKIEVTADGNTTTELPANATLTKLGDHYYMYVPEKLSWSKAYNKAKTYKYNGMQGYLATITTMDEYEAIHDRVGSNGGWIGGTLLVNADGGKIHDVSSIEQTEGTLIFPSTSSSYNNKQSGAIGDYYWACGPETGKMFTEAVAAGLDTGDSNEPNAYQHTGNDQPWSGREDVFGLTKYESCLLANNAGKLQINDIAEPGYNDGGYADGYFVEFGGYAECADPGEPDAGKTSTASYTFSHEHVLTYSASGKVITATCSNGDGLCDIPADGLTLTLSANSSWGWNDTWPYGYFYYNDEVAASAGSEDERSAWKNAGLEVPDVQYSYSATADGEYSSVDGVDNVGYYKASAAVGGDTVEITFQIKKAWVYIVGIEACDKEYDGTTEAKLDYKNVKYYEKRDGDDLGVTATGAFVDKNVGVDKKVVVTNLVLTGDDAGNYELYDNMDAEGNERSTTASITQREVKLTWGSTELSYTGKAQTPTCTPGNIVDDEAVSLNVTGARAEIGTGYTATAALDGAEDVISNYKLPENSTVTFSISKTSITPSISIGGWTYGDEANKPAVADDSNPGKGVVTYEYSKKGEDNWSDAVPTDAGEYTVRATVVETDFYKGGTAEVDFTIAPKSIEGAKVVLGAGLTANGSEQEQTVESVVLPDGTKLTANDYTLSGNKATDAGSYKLTVTGTGNYTGAVEVDFTVAKSPDEVAANEVVDKINAIGKVEYNEATREAIEAARKAYDALADEQKKLVDPAILKKLTDAETAYKQAKADAAKKEAERKNASKTVTKTTTTTKNNGLAVTGDRTPLMVGALAILGTLTAATGIIAKRKMR